MTGQDDLEEVTSSFYTHFDYPSCDLPYEIEGDVRGDTIKCEQCGLEFKVR